MRRIAKALLFSALILSIPAACLAGDWGNFWGGIHRDFKRNNCWYEPFVNADRASVREPFNRMVENGWRMDNTLSEQHFLPGEATLTPAGQSKIDAALANAPIQHRTLFVLRAETPELTAGRINAVQTAAAKRLGAGELPQVIESSRALSGAPASDIFNVNARRTATIPDPRLPEATATSVSGGE